MNEKRALSLGLASVLLWSTVATAFKLTLAELNPLQMVTVASIVSALALLVICAAMDKLKPDRPHFTGKSVLLPVAWID